MSIIIMLVVVFVVIGLVFVLCMGWLCIVDGFELVLYCWLVGDGIVLLCVMIVLVYGFVEYVGCYVVFVGWLNVVGIDVLVIDLCGYG